MMLSGNCASKHTVASFAPPRARARTIRAQCRAPVKHRLTPFVTRALVNKEGVNPRLADRKTAMHVRRCSGGKDPSEASEQREPFKFIPRVTAHGP
eukprot:8517021-Pyramimonas_sp.AAC.2